MNIELKEYHKAVHNFQLVFRDMLFAKGPHRERNAQAKEHWDVIHELAPELGIQPIAGIYLCSRVIQRAVISDIDTGRRIDEAIPDRFNLNKPPYRHYSHLVMKEVENKEYFGDAVRLSIPLINGSGTFSSYQPTPFFLTNFVGFQTDTA